MEYRQIQAPSFYINDKSAIRTYFRKQLDTIDIILKKRHRKISKKDIHELRIAVKKIKALSHLVLFCEPGFRIRKFMKPFKKIFTTAGKLRDVQLEKTRLKKMQLLGSLEDYSHRLKRRLKKKKHLFFSLANARFMRKLQKRSKMIFAGFDSVSATLINRFLEEKRNEISGLMATANLKENDAHRLRKILKELYYTSLVFDAKDTRFKNIDGFQQLLGQWHNDVVLKGYLQKALDNKNEAESELKIISEARDQISFESNSLFLQIRAATHGIDSSLLKHEKLSIQ